MPPITGASVFISALLFAVPNPLLHIGDGVGSIHLGFAFLILYLLILKQLVVVGIIAVIVVKAEPVVGALGICVRLSIVDIVSSAVTFSAGTILCSFIAIGRGKGPKILIVIAIL